jgi:hypothetical protein
MSLKVVVRPMQDTDKDFIMDSWIRGQYHGSPHWSQTSKEMFYKYYSDFISKILANPRTEVNVAVFEDAENVILGFSVNTGSTLHWVYTKADYRKEGIMNLLIRPLHIEQVSSTTLPGAAITKKKKLIFNPF